MTTDKELDWLYDALSRKTLTCYLSLVYTGDGLRFCTSPVVHLEGEEFTMVARAVSGGGMDLGIGGTGWTGTN